MDTVKVNSKELALSRLRDAGGYIERELEELASPDFRRQVGEPYAMALEERLKELAQIIGDTPDESIDHIPGEILEELEGDIRESSDYFRGTKTFDNQEELEGWRDDNLERVRILRGCFEVLAQPQSKPDTAFMRELLKDARVVILNLLGNAQSYISPGAANTLKRIEEALRIAPRIKAKFDFEDSSANLRALAEELRVPDGASRAGLAGTIIRELADILKAGKLPGLPLDISTRFDTLTRIVDELQEDYYHAQVRERRYEERLEAILAYCFRRLFTAFTVGTDLPTLLRWIARLANGDAQLEARPLGAEVAAAMKITGEGAVPTPEVNGDGIRPAFNALFAALESKYGRGQMVQRLQEIKDYVITLEYNVARFTANPYELGRFEAEAKELRAALLEAEDAARTSQYMASLEHGRAESVIKENNTLRRKANLVKDVSRVLQRLESFIAGSHPDALRIFFGNIGYAELLELKASIIRIVEDSKALHAEPKGIMGLSPEEFKEEVYDCMGERKIAEIPIDSEDCPPIAHVHKADGSLEALDGGKIGRVHTPSPRTFEEGLRYEHIAPPPDTKDVAKKWGVPDTSPAVDKIFGFPVVEDERIPPGVGIFGDFKNTDTLRAALAEAVRWQEEAGRLERELDRAKESYIKDRQELDERLVKLNERHRESLNREQTERVAVNTALLASVMLNRRMGHTTRAVEDTLRVIAKAITKLLEGKIWEWRKDYIGLSEGDAALNLSAEIKALAISAAEACRGELELYDKISPVVILSPETATGDEPEAEGGLRL